MATESTTSQHGIKIPVPDSDWEAEGDFNWNLLDDIIPKADTLANRPSAGTAGRKFIATDTKEQFYDDGNSWVQVQYAMDQDVQTTDAPAWAGATLSGDLTFTGTSDIIDVTIIGWKDRDGGGTDWRAFEVPSGGDSGKLRFNHTGDIYFTTAGGMRLTGNVGIGVDAGVPLHVKSTAKTKDGGIRLEDVDESIGYDFYIDSGNQLNIEYDTGSRPIVTISNNFLQTERLQFSDLVGSGNNWFGKEHSTEELRWQLTGPWIGFQEIGTGQAGIRLRGTTSSDPATGSGQADIYGKDVSGTTKAVAQDEAGNTNQLTSHDEDGFYYVSHSSVVRGIRQEIDVEKAIRFLEEEFGKDFIREFELEREAA